MLLRHTVDIHTSPSTLPSFSSPYTFSHFTHLHPHPHSHRHPLHGLLYYKRASDGRITKLIWHSNWQLWSNWHSRKGKKVQGRPTVIINGSLAPTRNEASIHPHHPEEQKQVDCIQSSHTHLSVVNPLEKISIWLDTLILLPALAYTFKWPLYMYSPFIPFLLLFLLLVSFFLFEKIVNRKSKERICNWTFPYSTAQGLTGCTKK